MSIQICNTCTGTGETREDVGYHNTEYVYHKCDKCNGTGRVLTRTYVYTIPYGTDTNIIYKYDKQICDLLRELEAKSKTINCQNQK